MFTPGPQQGNYQAAIDNTYVANKALVDASGGVKDKKAKLDDHKFTKTKEFADRFETKIKLDHQFKF